MALTRNFLKSINLTEEQVNAVIEAHTETTDALKGERDKYKAAFDKLPTVEAEVTRLTDENGKLTKSSGDIAKLQKEYDDYKASVAAEKTTAIKTAALRKLFRDSGVNRENFIDLLMGTIQLDSVEMEGDAIKGGADIITNSKASYGDLFGKEGKEGLPPTNPLNNGGGAMTLDSFRKLPLNEQMAFANEHPHEYAALK